jgi:cyanophycin synthetase
VLARNVADGATVVIKEGNSVSRRREGLVETYELAEQEPFQRVYWKEISAILAEK